MESVLNVVLPVFSLIFAGYLAARIGILGGESTDALNKFVYYIAMPIMLFHVVATLDPEDIFDWSFILGFLCVNVSVLVISMGVSMVVFRRDLADSALFAMSTVFGNGVYLGIPISVIAFGEAALSPAIVGGISQGIAMIIPIIILVELGVSQSSGATNILTKLSRSLVKNPVMMAPLAGLAWAMTGWPLPVSIDTFARYMAGAAGPSALFAIGLFLYAKPLHEGVVEVSSAVFIKILVQPILAWIFLFHVFDVDPLFAKVGLLLAILPTGANCFVLAQQYGRFVQRTSAIILITTVVAVVALSILLNLPIMTSE